MKPKYTITASMLTEAVRLIPKTQLHHHKLSLNDTLIGHLGEMIFAEYYHGSWKKHRIVKNLGEIDFIDIEVKCSAIPYRDDLNLLVKKSYAISRQACYYAQVIIDVSSRHSRTIRAGNQVTIAGFATHEQVITAPIKRYYSKTRNRAFIECHSVPISDLHDPSGLFIPHKAR